MSQGKFITFEGGEGVGKSTVINLIKDQLEADGYEVVLIRDPGGTALSEKIRHIVKHDEDIGLCRVAELFLFGAARAQLVDEVIEPAIAAGNIVLCDRFADSTLVYQGLVKGQADRQFVSVVNYASSGLTPDLTILFDMDVKEALTRTAGREFYDRFDSKGIEFHEEVRLGYEKLAQRYKTRIKTIDAAKEPYDVVSQAMFYILKRI